MLKCRLKVILAEHDMNQAQLSKAINARQATINKFCNNELKQLPLELLNNLCDYFKCTPSDILQYIDDADK